MSQALLTQPAAPKAPTPTNITKDAAEIEAQFPALHLTRSSRAAKRLGRFLLGCLVFAVLAAFFAPWQQSIRGEGAVIALDPYDRIQPVVSSLKGLVKERGKNVTEGGYVEKGELLFRVVDQNPNIRQQIDSQIEAAQREIDINILALERAEETVAANKRVVERTLEEIGYTEEARDALLEAADSFVEQARNKFQESENKLLAEQAKLAFAKRDFERQRTLSERGVAAKVKFQDSQQKFENAKANVGIAQNQIEGAQNQLKGKKQERDSKQQEWDAKITKVRSMLEKARSDVAKSQGEANKLAGMIEQKRIKLADMQGKANEQLLQEVVAPRSGYVMNLSVFEENVVKEGQVLCRIVPKTAQLAVELLVNGNDAPLIHEDDPVRLQFEGWPAVQFSGWPSVAVGTFGGRVNFVDPTDNGKGKFRIVVTPDPNDDPWPGHPYLRQGVRANGWTLLDVVPLGYELWRRMNGFPPALESAGASSDKGAKPPKVKI